MAKYKNLPSVNVELLDGNLRIDEPVSGPVVLIVGLAESGPSNVQYLSSDSNVAAAVYGSNSPIIKKMSEVKVGGAKNVLLYRIGGAPTSVTNLFGENSLLASAEETVSSRSKYKIYIGPSPLNAAIAGVIIFEGLKIVYSNMAGSEVDLGKFSIVGFDDSITFQIGTPDTPVQLEEILDTGNVTTSGANVTEAQASTGLATAYTLAASGDGLLEITLDGAVLAPSLYSWDPVTKVVTFGTAPVAGALEFISAVPQDVSAWAFPPVLTLGEDNLSCTWQRYYELLDEAYADLETTVATQFCTDKAIANAPNLADGSTETDKLSYVRTSEVDGVQVYHWSGSKTTWVSAADNALDVTDVLLAEIDANGQPLVRWQYHEVNFAHQMGSWLHTITENDRFVLGVIGTSGPLSNTTSSISKWLGTLPKKNALGEVTDNGTGLLGDRFMAGSTLQERGYYATDSGYPDGNVLIDSNGAPVELGKYLSVVSGFVVTPHNPTLGTTLRQENAAGMYTGLLSTISPGESTTNRVLPRVRIPFTLKKTKLDDLAYAGYVSVAQRTRGVVVVSGDLATSDKSDYDYVSTAIIIGDIIKRIRDRLDPFLGQGLNDILLAAADTAVEGVFQASVATGAVVTYQYQVISDPAERGKGEIRVPFTIVPAFELRQVTVTAKLAYEI